LVIDALDATGFDLLIAFTIIVCGITAALYLSMLVKRRR
jgi:hypothetical protein